MNPSLYGKVLRIDDDAGVKCRRINPRKRDGLIEIHQKLRHQLTRRRRRRLYVYENRILNKVLAPAMVVDDNDAMHA